MTSDPQTQTIPRVPAPQIAVCEPGVPAPGPEANVSPSESVQDMYEAGLAKLEALHDRWADALAEIRQAPVGDEPGILAA